MVAEFCWQDSCIPPAIMGPFTGNVEVPLLGCEPSCVSLANLYISKLWVQR